MGHWNFKKEVIRKLAHLISILILFVYIFFTSVFNHRAALFILALGLAIFIEFEYLRIEWSNKIPFLKKFFSIANKYRRESEKHKIGGEIYFLIGAIISLAVFDFRIAIAAILMATFGDFSAALFGSKFGKTWLPHLKNKSLEGALAELGVNLLIGFFIVRTFVDGNIWWLSYTGYFGEAIWPVIIAMALTATFVETVVQKIDDNLLIPLFAGLNGQIVLVIYTIFI